MSNSPLKIEIELELINVAASPRKLSQPWTVSEVEDITTEASDGLDMKLNLAFRALEREITKELDNEFIEKIKQVVYEMHSSDFDNAMSIVDHK